MRPRRPPLAAETGGPVTEPRDPLWCGAVRKAGKMMRQPDFLAQRNVGFGVKDWLTRRDQFASMSIGQESHCQEPHYRLRCPTCVRNALIGAALLHQLPSLIPVSRMTRRHLS